MNSSITLLCLENNFQSHRDSNTLLSVVPFSVLRASLVLSCVNTQKDCPHFKGLKLGNGYIVFRIWLLPLNLQTCLHRVLKQTNRGHFWEQNY